MKRKRFSTILQLVALLGGLMIAQQAAARDQIRIVGSSTVFPFSAAVAERFGKGSDFKTPIVESTGSGGGLKLFCAGIGESTPDITNSSRRIKASEVELCERNGVAEIVEVRIGFDGIVVANAQTRPRLSLTREQLFLALAKQIPVHGNLVANPNVKWSDVDPNLPDLAIRVLGPPPTSGTRDAFVELVMESGAKAIPMLADLENSDKSAFQAVAHSVREDGAYVEAGENDNLIVQKLQADPDSLGIFGFSFLDQNTDRIQGSLVEGIAPTFENISAGSYPVSRSLYFYVKKAHVGGVPGLEEYIAEFTSDGASGEEGYLADRGLIPLQSAARRAMRANALSLQVLDLAEN